MEARRELRCFKCQVGSNEGYLLLQQIVYCTGIPKPHEIIKYYFLSLSIFLSVCFHAFDQSLPRYYLNDLRRRELQLKVKGLESDAHISVSIETFRVEDFFSELESLWPLERITNFVRLTRESFAESSCHLQQSCRLTFKIPLSIHNRFIGQNRLHLNVKDCQKLQKKECLLVTL